MTSSHNDISKWYKESIRPLVFFALKILKDEEEAKDIVSDFWMRLIEHPPKIITKTFLYTSIRNACIDAIRAKGAKLRREAFYDSQEGESIIEGFLLDAELAKRINDEVEKLSPKCRLIFNESYLYGLNSNEISIKHRLSLQTVWNYKVTIINKLKLSIFK